MTRDELRERLANFAAAVSDFVEPLIGPLRTRGAALQLKDSSASAAANHRAAGRARSHAEFTSKIGIALEEADETVFWLEHLRRCRFVEPGKVDPLIAEGRELLAILQKSNTTARGNQEKRKRDERFKRRRPDDRDHVDPPGDRS